MSPIANAWNNPFLIDGETTPPMRSAFAVLNAEREELAEMSMEEILARSLAVLRRNPDLATVYGRVVGEEEIQEAAERLLDPKSRIVSELLDYRYHRLDLSDIGELREAVADYKRRFARPRPLRPTDASVIAKLLMELIEDTRAPEPPPLEIRPPGLPSTDDLLADLA